MTTKKTDYVNAQFDNATFNVEALFEEINKEIKGAEISTNYFAGNGYSVSVIVYRIKNTVHMVASYLLNTGYGFGTRAAIPWLYEWGIPKQRYYVEQRQIVGGNEYYKSFEIYPTDNGFSWYGYNSGALGDHYVGPAGPLIITDSWTA